MSRKIKHGKGKATPAEISEHEYRETLHVLQVELVKLQKHFIHCNDKILVLIEGRDAAGNDGVIKRIVEHLSPRETRVATLGNSWVSCGIPKTPPSVKSLCNSTPKPCVTPWI